MAHPSPLARYLTDRLAERHVTPDEYARGVGINASGFYKLLRGAYTAPAQRTLEKIASGLGMSAGELLAAVEAQDEADPVEQAIRQRTADMRAAVQNIPRQFWPTVIKATFDRAIEGARDMAELISNLSPEPPVSRSARRGVSTSASVLNGVNPTAKDDLAKCYYPVQAAVA